MNNDLISRSALLELYADTDEIKFDVYNVPVPVVRQNILDMPTIDAEPVRHGRWDAKIMKDIGTYTVYWCSECNCCIYFKYNYCPNCGAKMDGNQNGA